MSKSESFPRALVTGGGRRIGAELVRRCTELGFAVHIHVCSAQAEAEALRKTLPYPERHCVTVCDFSDEVIFRQWLAEQPAFQLLVNNASVYRLTRPGEMESAASRKRYWQINFVAPKLLLEKQYADAAQAGKAALAVNLLDCAVLNATGGVDAASEPPEGMDSYLYTRKKLAAATLKLAKEYAPVLRVNGIAPGPVLPPENCATPGMTKILDLVPLHHPVAVREIADALAVLCSLPSLTGVILPVDGGMHLGVSGNE